LPLWNHVATFFSLTGISSSCPANTQASQGSILQTFIYIKSEPLADLIYTSRTIHMIMTLRFVAPDLSLNPRFIYPTLYSASLFWVSNPNQTSLKSTTLGLLPKNLTPLTLDHLSRWKIHSSSCNLNSMNHPRSTWTFSYLISGPSAKLIGSAF
jgi:hypothetical protein